MTHAATSPSEPKRLLNRQEAADWMRISPRKFDQLGIPRIVIGRAVRFDPADLQAWCEAHKEGTER